MAAPKRGLREQGVRRDKVETAETRRSQSAAGKQRSAGRGAAAKRGQRAREAAEKRPTSSERRTVADARVTTTCSQRRTFCPRIAHREHPRDSAGEKRPKLRKGCRDGQRIEKSAFLGQRPACERRLMSRAAETNFVGFKAVASGVGRTRSRQVAEDHESLGRLFLHFAKSCDSTSFDSANNANCADS